MSPATNTVRFHRVLTAPPERVYRAFLDPAAMARWLPPHGFTATVHEMDARVGGKHRMSLVTLRKVSCGTELELEQSGIPAMIPVEMCYLGWQESLGMLAQIVEPNIPDGA